MFKSFSIESVFTIKKVYGKPQKTYGTGNTPYITGAKDNNGVVGFVKADEKSISNGNCISVDPITGSSRYQPVDFVGRGFSGASINILYNDNLDERTALFMCSVIEKVASKTAAYNNLFNSTRLSSAVIDIPVIENPNPDHEYTVDDINWQYMRDYIKELERDYIKELDAYLQATGLNNYELTEEDKKMLGGESEVKCTSFALDKLFAKKTIKGIPKKEENLSANSNGYHIFGQNIKDLTKISDNKLKELIWETFQCKIAVDYLYPVVKSKTITRKEFKYPFPNKTEERPCIILHNSDFHGFIAETKIKDPYCRDIIMPLWQHCNCIHRLGRIRYNTKTAAGGMNIIGAELNENGIILLLDSNVCKNWHELLDLAISSSVKEFHHNLEVINANHKRLVSLYNSDDDCSLKYVLLGYILSGIHINKSITDEEIVNILEALKMF